MKTSSRSGRFKKKLIAENELKAEASLIAPQLQRVKAEFESKKLNEYQACYQYLSIYFRHRYPTHTKWKSVPASALRALDKWKSGEYPLKLFYSIPSPQEVLALQTRGSRCVTIFSEEKQIDHYILGERDPLSFTLHDLIHADHFYQSPLLMKGQIGFYRWCEQILNSGLLDELMKNEKFLHEFEYLISDMNAYCGHLVKCFQSAIVFYGSKTLWIEILKMSYLDQDSSFAKINSSQFEDPDYLAIEKYLLSFVPADTLLNFSHSL